jgi:3',5'-cyclic AMP phosphodiesterase CpdA
LIGLKKRKEKEMNRRYFTLLLSAAILSYIIGCAPWVDQLDRDDASNKVFYEKYTIYDEGFNVETFAERIDNLNTTAEAEFPKLKDPIIRTGGRKVPEGPGEIEMVFVHLSDVQMRDERVKLFGRDASRTLDNFIPSFEHGTAPAHDQEHYDYAAYLALIRTINAYIEDETISAVEKPKFMIHTGDAVDASVVEELYEFIYISNQIPIPWFNVLGNHDVTVFGNFNNKKVYVNDPNLTFQTLHNKFNYINMHGGGHLVDPNINAGPPEAEHPDAMLLTGSRYHGFDLYNKEKNEQYIAYGIYLCRDCPGYYSFKLRKENGDYVFVPPYDQYSPKNTQDIVCIVLDTTTTQLGFAKGTVDEEQIKWLKKQLKGNEGKLILAFGHHPLRSSDFIDDSYETLIDLFLQYDVVAYFCGHTHAHQIRFHEEDTGQGFWEVITDSVLEYPQEGSLVTIRNFGNDTGAIDVQNFGRNIINDCQLKTESDLAFEDAQKDHIREIDEGDRNARLIFTHPYFAN